MSYIKTRPFKSLLFLVFIIGSVLVTHNCGDVLALEAYKDRGCFILPQGAVVCSNQTDALHIIPAVNAFVEATKDEFNQADVKFFLERLAINAYYFTPLGQEVESDFYNNECGPVAGCMNPYGAIYKVSVSKNNLELERFSSWTQTALIHEMFHGMENVSEGLKDYDHIVHPEHWSGPMVEKARELYCKGLGSMCEDPTY